MDQQDVQGHDRKVKLIDLQKDFMYCQSQNIKVIDFWKYEDILGRINNTTTNTNWFTMDNRVYYNMIIGVYS